MKLTVLTAADGASWEARLLADLSSGDYPIEVVRRCVDVVDLLAVAGAGLAQVVLMDAQLRRFDSACADRLAASGLVVVGVVEASAAADQDRLHSAGVDYFITADTSTEVLSTVMQAAVDELARDGGDPAAAGNTRTDQPVGGAMSVSSAQHGFADPAFATGSLLPAADNLSNGAEVTTPAVRADNGAVIAVWGPTGAPGRTTVAVALADEIARLNKPCLLVDADVYGGVIAAHLGLLDESPGVAAACRQAQVRQLDPAALAALSWQIGQNLAVLTGIARPDRWPELRPAALGRVLSVAASVMAYTVVDVGFALESDEELSFDTLAPRRNGATLAVLDRADLILAVGSADPIGLQRLVRGLAELKAAGVSAPVWIVLNQVRRGGQPGDPSKQLLAALERFTGQSAAALLPYHRTCTDSALAAGKTLAEVAPRSPLTLAMRELAAAVVGVPASRKGRRRR